ncbi:hypothetical protein [Plesiomonas shigelloides]|uniref:hypothetical protein n=1 Tax=Plesiomonas shigelloides TaxID=703 RepID=UPI00387F0122
MKIFFIVFSALIITACAQNPPVSPEVKAAAEKPLICNGKEQCDFYWERALFYVSSNSKFKVQTATDNLIQTFSPTGQTPLVGYQVVREPLSKDEYRIWVKVWCDNMFGCVPDSTVEVANIKKYIAGGTR